jgi:DNA-binding CsgD family transcriptional regulator
VLRELARLVNAQVGFLALAGLRPHVVPMIHDAASVGWRTKDEEARIYTLYTTSPPEIDPLMSLVMRTPGDMVTRKFSDAPCEYIKQEVHRPASVDSSLASLRRLPGGQSRVLILKRAWGEPSFEDEDCETVEIFRAENESLLQAPESHATHLSPRERETLDLLLEGLPEKLIAARMGLSRHTAHDYVKVLYRKLGVGSRAALMATSRRDLMRRKTG